MIIPDSTDHDQIFPVEKAGEDEMAHQQISEAEIRQAWVRESRIGRWFLSTNVWFQYVLSVAVADLKQLAADPGLNTDTILDAGCGRGFAFPLLEKHFQPKTIIGVDIDEQELEFAAVAGNERQCNVTIEPASITHLSLPAASVDVIFCHQLLHHVTHQREVLNEFFRVLKPGGTILISESCRSFIHSPVVRTFFRHPKGVQKSPTQYIDLVRQTGFLVEEKKTAISTPYWTHSDFGLRQKLGLAGKPIEPTEILIVARKTDCQGSEKQMGSE